MYDAFLEKEIFLLCYTFSPLAVAVIILSI